jgi:phage protein U
MIGYLGDVIFETSDSRILNFSGFVLESASRFAAHEVIGKKPKTEFIGPGLNTVTFTINLNGNHGVKPREEMTKWIIKSNSGKAFSLVIGGRVLGADKWVVKSISEAWDTLFNGGELFSGKIEVTIEEYISILGSSVTSNGSSAKTTTNSSGTGTVTATILNVRTGPGVTYKILGGLSKGRKVSIISSSGNWYKISYNSSTGYVYKKYIKV